MDTTEKILEYAQNLLESGFVHPEWDIRFAACEALASSGDRRGIRILAEALEHQNSGIRDRAVVALKSIGDRNLCPHFDKVLEDLDPLVRGHAVEAVTSLEKQHALDKILRGLSDKNDFVKECAIVALSSLGDFGHPVLVEIARGHEPYAFIYPLRLSAAYYLAEQKNGIGTEELRHMLTCGDMWISLLAACNLADLGYDDGLLHLKNAIAKGNWQEKIIALESIIKLEGELEKLPLYRPKDIPPDFAAKIQAAVVLDKFSPGVTEEVLREALKNEQEIVQEHAMQAIARLGRKELGELLIDILRHSPEHLRASAVLAIEKIGEIELLSHLVPVLERSHWLLRLQAARVAVNLAAQK